MSSKPITTDGLRAAIEGRDATVLNSFYRSDAVLRIIDVNHPPSQPLELRGRAAISAHFDDVCGRDMTHRVGSAVAEGDRIAFEQTCTYPGGARVVCQSMLQLTDGTITRQVMLQVWDA